MSARSKARKRALDAIFQADLNNKPISTQEETEEVYEKYSDVLINGIKENQTQIDSLIAESLTNWTIDRIPRVDRNILRIAVYELLFQKDVPVNVVISEAVKLAEDLSTDDSAAFVNGTLANIVKKI
ncbi:MAG: transcription antitermination factor NusB [Actinobacteria bacterium]|nr:transcription antitermination factor NusB [Actinomycetota bacterium]